MRNALSGLGLREEGVRLGVRLGFSGFEIRD